MTEKKKPKYTKGKLSSTEEFAIKGMFRDGLSESEIVVQLNRSPRSKIVEDYLKGMEPNYQVALPDSIPTKEEFDEDLYASTLKELMNRGIAKKHAIDLIQNSLDQIQDEADPKEASKLATNRVLAKDLMINEAAQGQKGVAVMTQAATERADEAKKSYRDKQHPAVFRPKDK